tara:strand:+ start:3122 stop:3649 length:528 start_codon:yes stop_codon:yes gene_type:complete
MAYFDRFPTGRYDIAGDKNYKLVTDIFKRIKVRSKIQAEASLYDTYDVPAGERPEITAFKHFGSADLHWVILLTNNITDAYHDWPMSNSDFETFVFDKYANPDAIHHYEVAQSSGKTTSNDFSHVLEVNSDHPGAQSVSNYEYEQRLQDEKRKIKLLQPQFLNVFIEEFDKLINR